MSQRFFKLLYVFALIGLVLSAPIYLLQEIRLDAIVSDTYKAKCLSNNQYVVLQGAAIDEVYEVNEHTLNDPLSDTKRTLNFYCKYYDEIQPYIIASNENPSQAGRLNLDYSEFRNPRYDNVSIYPALYELEVVKRTIRYDEFLNPIVVWLVGAAMAFVLLQIIRMSYVYVVFGEVVWHPFRQRKPRP